MSHRSFLLLNSHAQNTKTRNGYHYCALVSAEKNLIEFFNRRQYDSTISKLKQHKQQIAKGGDQHTHTWTESSWVLWFPTFFWKKYLFVKFAQLDVFSYRHAHACTHTNNPDGLGKLWVTQSFSVRMTLVKLYLCEDNKRSAPSACWAM